MSAVAAQAVPVQSRARGGITVTSARRLELSVFLVALGCRLWQLFAGGQGRGAYGYDQSVYYAAATGLTHGKAPYHGHFIFLHPPMIAIVGTPFAILGRLTTDATGFVWESMAFCVLAAINAVLVVRVGVAWGLRRRAAAAGGLFYGVWIVAVTASSGVRLEPLGDFFFLLTLAALAHARGPRRDRALIACGVCAGLLLNVKIWWVAPLVVVIVWTAIASRSWRGALVPLAAAAVAAAVIDLPFLIVAGGRMYRSIISDQIGRTNVQWTGNYDFIHLSRMTVLEELTGSNGVTSTLRVGQGGGKALTLDLVTIVICVFFLTLCVLASRSKVGRIFVAMVIVQAVVLLLTPIYYSFYGDYISVGVSLVSAFALKNSAPTSVRGAATAVWSVGAVLSTTLIFISQGWVVVPQHSEAVRTFADVPCIVSDNPGVLIQLDALSRSFSNGCRNVVDYQGLGHGGGPNPDAYLVATKASPAYRREAVRYFASGDAFVIGQLTDFALGAKDVARVRRHHVLVSSGGFHIWVREHALKYVRGGQRLTAAMAR